MIETPFDLIKNSLFNTISGRLINKLPDKWEKIGDVVIIRVTSELFEYKEIIGPPLSLKEHCKIFKQKYSKTYSKEKRLLSKIKREHTIPEELIKELLQDNNFKKNISQVKLL